jgi:hypothetical protein
VSVAKQRTGTVQGVNSRLSGITSTLAVKPVDGVLPLAAGAAGGQQPPEAYKDHVLPMTFRRTPRSAAHNGRKGARRGSEGTGPR